MHIGVQTAVSIRVYMKYKMGFFLGLVQSWTARIRALYVDPISSYS